MRITLNSNDSSVTIASRPGDASGGQVACGLSISIIVIKEIALC